MNLETVQMFWDLIETGSFSRAAEKNFVSQSAVSQRLRALEREYGKTLVERGQGRGRAAPTSAGQLLYDSGKRLLQDAATLETQLREESDEAAGTVRVATVYSVGLHALPPRLKPFLAAHPRINVHLEYQQTAQIYQGVANGSVDVGIVACPAPRRGIEIVAFDEEPMALVLAPEHALAQFQTVQMQQLDGIAFIGFADDIPTRRLVDDALEKARVRVRVRLVSTFDNIETIKNLVEIGSGVSILPLDSVRQEVRAGTLAAVSFAPEDAFTRPTGLLLKTAKTRRAAVQAFVDAIREKTASL